MPEPKKDELVKDAEAAGVDDASKLTKPELADELEALNPPELGPVIREGQSAPEPPRSSGKPIVGIQPATYEDIPEAAR